MKKIETPADRNKRWEMYTTQSQQYIKDKNFGFYRNVRFDMAMLLKKENKHPDTLAMFTEVIFWDLTGCGNNFDHRSFIDATFGFLFPYGKSIMKLAPGVIREVGICQRKLTFSDEQLKAEMLNFLQPMTAPIQFFTCAEIVSIFFLERDKNAAHLKKDAESENKNIAKLQRLYSAAKKRFDPKHPNTVK